MKGTFLPGEFSYSRLHLTTADAVIAVVIAGFLDLDIIDHYPQQVGIDLVQLLDGMGKLAALGHIGFDHQQYAVNTRGARMVASETARMGVVSMMTVLNVILSWSMISCIFSVLSSSEGLGGRLPEVSTLKSLIPEGLTALA